MKKLILSSVAFLGLSVALVAPAQAQVIVNSTPSGGSVTGAASFTNINGATSAIAGEITYPSYVYPDSGVTVTLTAPVGTVASGEVILVELNVAADSVLEVLPNTGTSVESAVASEITAATGDLNAQVSLIRAWTSGGLN